MKRARKPDPELDPTTAAIRRLNKAGVSSDAAVRQRIALIAAERNLNPSETKPLMTGRSIPLHPLGQFSEKHNLSLDWLLPGDLKGLKRTAEWKTQGLLSVATTREMQLAQWQELSRKKGAKADQLEAPTPISVRVYPHSEGLAKCAAELFAGMAPIWAPVAAVIGTIAAGAAAIRRRSQARQNTVAAPPSGS